jgi:hypothetical protein
MLGMKLKIMGYEPSGETEGTMMKVSEYSSRLNPMTIMPRER